ARSRRWRLVWLLSRDTVAVSWLRSGWSTRSSRPPALVRPTIRGIGRSCQVQPGWLVKDDAGGGTALTLLAAPRASNPKQTSFPMRAMVVGGAGIIHKACWLSMPGSQFQVRSAAFSGNYAVGEGCPATPALSLVICL